MTEMVERVAIKLYDASEIRRLVGTAEQAWESELNRVRTRFIEEARSIIETMREPTATMEIVAGRDNVAGDHGDPRSTWLLMIDEALK